MLGIGKKINTADSQERVAEGHGAGRLPRGWEEQPAARDPHSKIMIDCGISPEPGIKGLDANASGEVNKAFPYLDSANMSINEHRRGGADARAHGPRRIRPLPVQVRLRGPGLLHAAHARPGSAAAQRLHEAGPEERRHPAVRREGHKEDADAHHNQGLRRGHQHN